MVTGLSMFAAMWGGSADSRSNAAHRLITDTGLSMFHLPCHFLKSLRRYLQMTHRQTLTKPFRGFHCAVTCLFILVALPSAFAATLTGRVVDAHTGESIANAEVSEQGSQLKVLTDKNGGFTLTGLPVGNVQLLVTCIGYDRSTQTVHLASGASAPMVVALYPEASTPTQTVTVTAPVFDTLDATNPSSEETLSKQEIQALSLVLLGDPMRAAQALPGVTSNNDFDSQFSIRGAGPEQVGVYIDGVSTHDFFDTFSFSSGGVGGTANLTLPIVNADMVSGMSLLPGAYPSNYGDSTAAIFNMDTREGDFKKFSGRLTYGLLGSSGIVDGPFANHKGSWILSGNTSHLSDLTGVIGNVKSYNSNSSKTVAPEKQLSFNFNNFQNKEVYKLSDRQQIGISAIYGNFTANKNLTSLSTPKPPDDLDTLNSQHLLADAFWKYVPSAKFLAQAKIYTVVSQSNDKNLYGGLLDRNGATETGFRADVSYQLLPSQQLDSGVYVSNLAGHQTSYSFQDTQPTIPSTTLVNYGHSAAEESFYLLDTWQAKHFALTGGGRIVHSDLTGQTVPLPQGALTYHMGESWTFRAGAGSYAEFPVLDEEFGYYGNQSLRAEISDNYNLSVARALGHYARVLTEVYDREDRNQIFSLNGPRLVNGQTELLENPYENSVHGHARGVEITLQRRSANKLTGWVSYAYSETMYYDPHDQLQFVSDYDQRHTLNLFASYRLKPTFAISTQYRYGSGMPIPGFVEFAPGGAPVVVAQRNQARLPAYSRLDFRANKAWSFHKYTLTLAGELLNVTDHANYFLLGQDPMRIQSASDFTAQEKKSLPILPAVSVTFEF